MEAEQYLILGLVCFLGSGFLGWEGCTWGCGGCTWRYLQVKRLLTAAHECGGNLRPVSGQTKARILKMKLEKGIMELVQKIIRVEHGRSLLVGQLRVAKSSRSIH
ncbi:xanthine dehydrogenase [Striga asiatica]|uniref:Xanthine dehydrogenase n=1 Tax=Striga asiatica TaxID=4170 RepID=A0A5A7QXR8_STRAF|nr:xanthine dehydrogenase [Striga asiatica]